MTCRLHRLVSAVLLALSACAAPRFEGVEVVGERYDGDVGAYVVQVRFEVLKGDLPVQGLTSLDFRMYEDDVRATTESIQELDLDELRLPVTLLLDTSYSIYRSGSIEALKRAARTFVGQLRDDGFEVDVLSFDSEVRELADIESIPSTWEGREQNARWTALYHAVQQALRRNERSILVVFSDGADNYSQNHGVESFDAILPDLLGRQVHAVGFGAVRDEFDRSGNPASKVLRRLSQDGTYGFASDDDAIQDVFDFIARRLRNIYFVEYYSPNRRGEHGLVLRYRSAETEPILFTPSVP